MKQIKLFTIDEYAQNLKEKGLLVEANITDKNENIEELTFNSKEAKKNTLFICKGAAFKEEYLIEALKNGVICYVSEKKYENIDKGISYLVVSDIRKAMPLLASIFFNEPAKDLKITAVGGTKGKSTTAYYVKAIIDEYLAAKDENESAIISSINTYDGVIFEESHITTPENIDLQRHFRNAVNSGISFLEMEASSQALKYNRLDGIMFDVGIFLNVSEDHISPIEHPDFEDYISSKLKIFKQSKTALVSTNSDCFERVMEASRVAQKVFTFGTKEGSDFYGYDLKKVGHATHFKVKCSEFDSEFVLNMPGFFNVENALAAIATACVYGIPEKYIYEGIKKAKSSGRMELFESNDGKVTVIVDYAHNKLSFEKLFESTRNEYPEHQIISIFGCPGGKAYGRRKELPLIAGKYSKKAYLVAEDPGNDPVIEISKTMAQYLDQLKCPYEMIEERGEAIQKAIFESFKDDKKTIILITGKGNETRQKYGNEYIDCISDVEYAKKYLQEGERL